MILIFGLGNPGKQYEKTRHNVGAGFIDYLVKKENIKLNSKYNSKIADLKIFDEKIILVKPQTYMNNSGTAVLEIKNFYKVSPSQIFLAFDDLDIPIGKYKIQYAKYPKIHNGVNDVIAKLGTDQFFFIRIGIDERTNSERKFVTGADYVLGKTEYDFNDVYKNIYLRLRENINNLPTKQVRKILSYNS